MLIFIIKVLKLQNILKIDQSTIEYNYKIFKILSPQGTTIYNIYDKCSTPEEKKNHDKPNLLYEH